MGTPAGDRVSANDELLAVSHGRLGERSDKKHPARFWPLATAESFETVEEAGIYLHPESFEAAAVHEGEFVLELCQGGVTLNIRRL